MTITKLDSSKVKEWMQDTWKLKYPCVLQGRGLTTSLNQIKLKCTVPSEQ